MRIVSVSAIVAGFMIVSVAAAEENMRPRQPSPEEMQRTMDAAMGAMVPMMGRMTEAMLEAQLRVAERPETAERIAAFKKNLFDALKKKGFSAEEALQITMATALPSATPGGK